MAKQRGNRSKRKTAAIQPPPHRDDAERLWTWLVHTDRQLWALGLVPVVVAGASLLLIARGDLTTLSELIRTSTTSQLVFGATLPLVPAALMLLPSMWLERIYYRDQVPKATPLLILGIYALAYFTVPSVAFTTSMTTCGLLYLFVLLERHYFKSDGRVRVFSLAQLVILAATLWPLMNSYLSPEVVGIREGVNEKYLSAYVLTSDATWTKLLKTSGGVRVVSSKLVVSREPCHKARPAPGSAYERQFGSHETNPRCADLLKTKPGVTE